MYLTTLLLTLKSAHIIGGDASQAALPHQIFPLKNGTVWTPFSPTQMESINNCLFSSQQWLVISSCHLCTIWFVWLVRQSLFACVSRDSGLWFVALVPGKCILNCTETLLHPQTGRSQITSQLLCGCGHAGREEYKMDGWENVIVGRGGVFHPLISEAAGVLLSGVDGQGCDVNVWSTPPFCGGL